MTRSTDIAIPVSDASGTPDQTKEKWLLAVVSLLSVVYFAGLAYYAAVRPVDGDEGFYTTAARLVWEGKTPYRDFFYQQAPLLPYVYSWIWAIHPHSLFAMRTLSAAFTGIATLMWGVWLVHMKRFEDKIVVATFLTVLLNPYWLSWNVVVKTFAFSNLMVSVALICLYAGLRSSRSGWYFGAGLALGVCTSARSLYGLLIPGVLIWLLLRGRRLPASYLRTGLFLAGAACGLIPLLVSFAHDPRAFLFNNVQYHGLQAGYLPEGGKIVVGYQNFRYTVLAYIGFIVVLLLGLHPYFTIEAILGLAGAVSLWRLHRRHEASCAPEEYRFFEVAFLVLLVYTAEALVPFPPYDQYFISPLVPFLIPFVAEGWRAVFQSGRKWVVTLAVLAPVLFVFGIRREAWEYSRNPMWRVSSYHKVTAAIETNSQPEDVVLSLFPGYVFESGRRYFPGLEDQFSFRIIDKIGPNTTARYRIVSKAQINNALANHAPALLVIYPGSEYFNNLSAGEMQAFDVMIEENYSLVTKVDDVAVYRRKTALANQAAPGSS